ncbi:MAG: PDZ domain-containing protein, partial [Verrucomicrobia bacterium]|nr:PDZ domain-containing protein [Verrucomicrobiota bacterium]
MLSRRQSQRFNLQNMLNDMKRIAIYLFAGFLPVLLAGCASKKTVSQRGWIGGSYVLSRHNSGWVRLCSSPGISGTLPKSVQATQNAAVEITTLATNTPARLAGLHEGDFILELNHQPVTSLQTFRRTIDRSAPGTLL